MQSNKPVIIVSVFDEKNGQNKLDTYGKGLLEEHFCMITENDIGQDPSLYATIEGLIVSPLFPSKLLERSAMEKMKALKVVVTLSAGYNHIDVGYLRERGIRIGTSPGGSKDAVAELAITLVLACGRELRQGMEIAMGQNPVTYFSRAICHQEIAGSTLGIIGMGNIGVEIARRSQAMKMVTLFYDPYFKQGADMDINARSINTLEELLPLCDFVVIACPLNDHTRGLVSTKEFKIMKRSAFLVNIGRGAVVDTSALVHALKTEEIAGAGLDVTDPEPLPRDHELLKQPNVIITPHCGASTFKAGVSVYKMALANLVAALLETNTNMPFELKN